MVCVYSLMHDGSAPVNMYVFILGSEDNLSIFLFCLFETGSISLNWDFAKYVRLASQKAPGIHLSLSPSLPLFKQAYSLMFKVLHESLGFNSGPPAFKAKFY